MPPFSGTLNTNEIFAGLFNQILSLQTFEPSIAGNNVKIVDEAKTDGGMFGDQKLFFSTDCLASSDWLNDAEAANLLNLYRPEDPETQAIVVNIFRNVKLTIDYYLTKRAWGSATAFYQFQSVMLTWIRKTKRIYEKTTYNVFIGNNVTNVGKQKQECTLTGSTNRGLDIALFMANLVSHLTDVSRMFNDYGHIQEFSKDEIKIIWNSKYVNEILKKELPVIFHNDKLFNNFDYVLPESYFGEAPDDTASSGNLAKLVTAGELSETSGTYKVLVDDCKVRAKKEIAVTVGDKVIDVFAGQPMPKNYEFTEDDFDKIYVVNENVICKVVTKLPPLLSGFEVQTSFFNPASLTETEFLIWAHNTLEHLKEFPFITVYEI